MKESYLYKRLSQLGKPENLQQFKVQNHLGKKEDLTFFSSDEFDNLLIHYNMLVGCPWRMKKPGTREQPKPYIRTRLKSPTNPAVKYLSPRGCGLLPYFPPSIISKYQNKEKIHTLFLIEGELKSFSASINGIDAIGLGSIHGFYADNQSNEKRYKQKELASEIIDILNVCKVESLVYLTDADTLSLNYEPDKEMSKRPRSFYSAVNNFRNAAKLIVYDENFELKDFYYMHIKEKFNPISKGIDDLFFNHKKESKGITEDAHRLDLAYQYFKCFDLRTTQETHLKKYFGLVDKINFWETYKDFLHEKEFQFKEVIYYHDGEYLATIKNRALEKYMRIGTKYLRKGFKTIDFEGFLMQVPLLKPWEKTAINEDHGKGAALNVKRYFDFVNEPDWLNHRQEIGELYNVCHPIFYTPKEGKINHSIDLVKHLANNEDFISISENGEVVETPEIGNIGTMLLDYLSIMIQHPKHQLPIPCFLSREQETGKTTFIVLIQKMFTGNSIIIQTRDFTGQFNSHWAGRFFVAIDEGNFVEKINSKEQIKYYSTTPDITVNEKGIAQFTIDNYSKFAICSNAEEDFLILDKTDKRFWIHKVKSITKKDPDFNNKLFKEIPSFFHYLANRSIFHPRSNRNWFDEKLIMNENFNKFVVSSRPAWKAEIDECFIHLFENLPELDFVEMSITNIIYNLQALNKHSKISIKLLKQFLRVDLGLMPLERKRFNSWKLNHLSAPYEITHENASPYKIERKNFNVN